MRERGSDIDCEMFVIVDAWTMRDSTVLIVMKELLAEDEAGPAFAKEVRMAAEMVFSRLSPYEARQAETSDDYIVSQRHEEENLRPLCGQLTIGEEEKLYESFDDSSSENM